MARICAVLAVMAAVAGSVGPPARADDVTDQIDEALQAYRKKDMTTAAAALDAAATLIRQKRAEVWQTMLPEPLSGWTAEKAESASLAPALLGGGTSISRRYRNGGAQVTISLIADSPVVQGVAAFLSSGIAALVGDNRLVVLDGRRLVYNKTDNSYQTLVGSRVLVKVEGNGEVDDATLRRYLGAINYAAVERMAQ
jgi:hypothetical protein